MVKQVNGWQRIGILTSLGWVIFITAIAINYSNPGDFDENAIFAIFLFTIAPIIFFWVSIYIIVWVVKWVAAGFRGNNTHLTE